MDTFLFILDLYARAGGGGSGGGGGGGGGGGLGPHRGTHDDLIGLLFVLPIPIVIIGFICRKKMHNLAGALITIICTLAYAKFLMLLGMGPIGVVLALVCICSGLLAYFDWARKVFMAILKILFIPFVKPLNFLGWYATPEYEKSYELCKPMLKRAAQTNPIWSEKRLTAQICTMFLALQADWSNFNTQSIETYTTQPYAQHMTLMLAALKFRQRRNDVQKVRILRAIPIGIVNDSKHNRYQVDYCITAKAKDSLLETVNNTEKVLYTDRNQFTEIWHMVHTDGSWRLDSIEQATARLSSKNSKIKAFAQENGLFYSLDWGWLLLPRRGVLFNKGAFGVSDINNHVIGITHRLLIELYTYKAIPKNSWLDPTYTIAQVALPKRYGSIIVAAKPFWLKRLFSRVPKGYRKVTMEWPTFNKRYAVYATDVEQVTAFELLHPAYMEKLSALPFKVSIEVVDNVVYLYTTSKKADYTLMLALLQNAFKEMRL